MKWYDADKKKPIGREEVLAYPSAPYPTVTWWEKKKAWHYSTPTGCYSVGPRDKVKKWAYIEYPKGSFERLMCIRKWKPLWKKIWEKITK